MELEKKRKEDADHKLNTINTTLNNKSQAAIDRF